MNVCHFPKVVDVLINGDILNIHSFLCCQMLAPNDTTVPPLSVDCEMRFLSGPGWDAAAEPQSVSVGSASANDSRRQGSAGAHLWLYYTAGKCHHKLFDSSKTKHFHPDDVGSLFHQHHHLVQCSKNLGRVFPL